MIASSIANGEYTSTMLALLMFDISYPYYEKQNCQSLSELSSSANAIFTNR